MALNLKLNIKGVQIPKPARYAIAIGIPLLIVILFYFLYYSPKSKEIQRLKSEIAKQEQEISNAEVKLRKLPKLKALYAIRLKELEDLKRQLPEEKEVSGLLKQVSDLGIKSGLVIGLWKPSNKRTHPSGVVYEIPVKVEMRGAFHRLGYFFSALSGLNRIVNISDLKLGNPEVSGNEAVLKISFNAVTFSSVPESEAKKASTTGKRQRGRRR
jgi:type IV pilus assembly protein PilO